ncbi:MAG: thioredoxin domain-containing protein [Ignavibacteriales bacterium]|nr:thioredoxin domain-containing protein [Ignavibacteriales bacterium]
MKPRHGSVILAAVIASHVPYAPSQQMKNQEKPASLNRLHNEPSSYLRSAAHQPVHWYPWGDEAFKTAKRENKPILLDIGAAWCHWCHVMDSESYENDSISSVINQHFVAVKVDRDERPDIDSRYQAAVSAISGQGGWPLTAFLTPDGNVFYGGTYFPPEDRFGRTGFPKVLKTLAETYRNEPDKILQNVGYIADAVQNYLARTSESRDLNDSLVDPALNSISQAYDTRFGGFGSAPKFPHAGAIELLLTRYDQTRETWMIDAIKNTLRRMARGGIHDQLGGGFHRYSTDEKWIVPHFEKMLYDNAPLLKNYVHAFQATGDEFFKSVALDILDFSNDVLSDRAKGGFYASQDADVDAGDDGSYFTWTMSDAASLLDAEEFRAIQLHYNIFEQGEMHHDPTQNVLFIDKDPDVVASVLKRPQQDVDRSISSAKSKMFEARRKRNTPFVDRTMYSGWNGMMVSAYLDAYKAFGNAEVKDFALRSLDRILEENSVEAKFITHRSSAAGKEGFLDDQVEIANALLDAYEVTGNFKYAHFAESIAKNTVERFWDAKDGGFTDTPTKHETTGALSIVNKPIQDSPTPGANAVAIRVFNRLYVLTENQWYRDYAEKTLKYFSGTVQGYGLFAATYFLALHEFLKPPPHVVVVADKEQAGTKMFKAALTTYCPGKVVTRVSPSDVQHLPSTVKAMAQSYNRPVAYVCTGFTCAPPVYNPESLVTTLRSLAKSAEVTK